MVSLITLGGKLSFLTACSKSVNSDLYKIKEVVMNHLKDAINTGTFEKTEDVPISRQLSEING